MTRLRLCAKGQPIDRSLELCAKCDRYLPGRWCRVVHRSFESDPLDSGGCNVGIRFGGNHNYRLFDRLARPQSCVELTQSAGYGALSHLDLRKSTDFQTFSRRNQALSLFVTTQSRNATVSLSHQHPAALSLHGTLRIWQS